MNAFPFGAPSAGADPLWSSVLETLRARLAPRTGDAADLVAELDLIERSAKALRIGVPQRSIGAWLEDGRLQLLTTSVANVTDGTCQVALLPKPANVTQPGVDPTRAVSRFIAGPGSQASRARAESLVHEAGRYPSLVSFHGAPGSGKSHLLHGIAQGLRERADFGDVIATDAETLSHALIASLRSGELDSFREQLRAADALLLDDVDALAGRDATQEELLGALDPLFGRRALIAVTSKRPIHDVPDLLPELRERLAGGASVGLVCPPWEARVAIVLDRISAWGVECRPEVAALIANVLGEHLGLVDAQLTRLLSHPSTGRRLHDIDAVRRVLADEDQATAPLSPDVVVDLVTGHFNLRVSDLRSPSRSPRLTTPRQIGMYLLRRHCGLSYPEIGQCFRRHHTTAMHACRRIETRREKQSSLRATIGLLEKELLRISDRAAAPNDD